MASPFEPRQPGHYALDPTLVPIQERKVEGQVGSPARVHALHDQAEEGGLSLALGLTSTLFLFASGHSQGSLGAPPFSPNPPPSGCYVGLSLYD